MKITIEAQTYHDKDAPRRSNTGEREAMRWLVQVLNDEAMRFERETESTAPLHIDSRGLTVTVTFNHE